MQDKHLFEYAIIRIVPRVEREEFLNAGVVLYCGRQKFLEVIYRVDEQRLKTFSPDMDMDEIREYFRAFENICKGSNDAGPIGKLSLAERFRWLTATRSTIVQLSKVHTGLCVDGPHKMLDHLYSQMVL